MNRRLIASILAAASVAALSVTPAFAQVRHDGGPTLNGVGSTADAPLLGIAFNGAHYSAATVTYDSVGSGGGQKSLAANCGQSGGIPGTWDFGAWDVVQNIPGDNFCDASKITQFPITSFGEAIITHGLPKKAEKNLKLTGSLLNSIYTGAIKSWGDKHIVKLNPALKGSKLKISPVVRSDSSGTTFVYTSYLCASGTGFNKKYGTGSGSPICPSKLPAWTTVFASGKGNAGVDNVVENTPGSIGYVETFYASSNGETPAYLQNKAGKFVQPSVATITSDVKNGTKRNFNEVYPNFVISNAPGKASYPIAGFSWAGVYTKGSDGQDPANCGATKAALQWFVSSSGGQKYAAPNGYVPLASKVQAFAKTKLSQVSC